MVLREALFLVCIGLAFGVPAALLLGQTVRAGIWGAESALVSLAGRG